MTLEYAGYENYEKVEEEVVATGANPLRHATRPLSHHVVFMFLKTEAARVYLHLKSTLRSKGSNLFAIDVNVVANTASSGTKRV